MAERGRQTPTRSVVLPYVCPLWVRENEERAGGEALQPDRAQGAGVAGTDALRHHERGRGRAVDACEVWLQPATAQWQE